MEQIYDINLRAKSKLGFVLRTCRKSDYNLELEEQWEKCNAFVLAWIINTVSKELLSGIVYVSDATMVWAYLNERFNKVDGSRSYPLHCEICTLNQGNLTVSGYFTKLRLLWDEFDVLVLPPACNCNKSRTYVDHLQFLRLFAFLMGLSEVYIHARSQILMMNKLSTSTSGGNIDNIDKEQHVANTAMANTASAHIAGIPTTTLLANSSNLPGASIEWIVDSRATCHMTHNIRLLNEISNSSASVDKKVHLPNGQTTLVAHTGNCRLPTDDVLNNVLVVPEFKFDLLSDLFNGKVKGTGKERGCLYYFPSHLSEKVWHVEQGLMAQTENSEGIVWNSRLGHPPVRVLKHFSLLKRFTDEEAYVWGLYRNPTHTGFRAEACVLLGYSATQKSYIVYSLTEKRLLVSRDVISKEGIFPFAAQKEKLHPPMFPANDIVFYEERVLAEDVPHLEIHDNASVDNANADLEDAQGDVDVGLADGVIDAIIPNPVIPNEMVVEQRIRQSTRSSKPPVWLKDFVTNAIGSDTMFKLKQRELIWGISDCIS
ncbi:hypothetical protein KY290_007821 [Solanum tuberosum]|uniref:Retrotransposon gag domain-containing protein n=1 Tax=Solanum tuberosum TaxID=4113 RepID=A0ABQ7W6N6_SOLTU|nr:hypothetical protein KY290_007821 [Solanum tuberosum]